jgi:DNA-binding response OmpR family regulator
MSLALDEPEPGHPTSPTTPEHQPGTLPSTIAASGQDAPHVLVVDDDSDILDILAMLLSDDGFHASVCTDSAEAKALLQTEPVHLLVTDLRLGGANGMELIRHVHEALTQPPKMIVLTGFEVPRTPEIHLLQQHGGRIIAKPFDIDQLLGAARELTGWRGKIVP